MSKRRPGITVSVVVKDSGWRAVLPNLAMTIRRWAREALQPHAARWGNGSAAVTLVLANEAFIRPLNRTYRGKDKATNVLSFPMLEMKGRGGSLEIAGEPAMLGDIVLARETILREAAKQEKLVPHHLAHLVVHGCFHLLGYDHERRTDARIMETLEKELLARWGIPDPYSKSTAHS